MRPLAFVDSGKGAGTSDIPAPLMFRREWRFSDDRSQAGPLLLEQRHRKGHVEHLVQAAKLSLDARVLRKGPDGPQAERTPCRRGSWPV